MKERERGGRTHINICKDCANHEEEHSWVRVDDVWSWGLHPDSGQDEKDKWCEEWPQCLTPPQHLPSLVSVWPAVIILSTVNMCHLHAIPCSLRVQGVEWHGWYNLCYVRRLLFGIFKVNSLNISHTRAVQIILKGKLTCIYSRKTWEGRCQGIQHTSWIQTWLLTTLPQQSQTSRGVARRDPSLGI